MEHQPVRIDQEMLGFGNLRRDMGEDEVIPAVQRHQSVAGGEVHPRLPFGGADLRLKRRQGMQRSHRGHLLLLS